MALNRNLADFNDVYISGASSLKIQLANNIIYLTILNAVGFIQFGICQWRSCLGHNYEW